MRGLVKRLPEVMLALRVLSTAPQTANAVSGLYLSLGLGYGAFTGDQFVVHEAEGPTTSPTTIQSAAVPATASRRSFDSASRSSVSRDRSSGSSAMGGASAPAIRAARASSAAA